MTAPSLRDRHGHHLAIDSTWTSEWAEELCDSLVEFVSCLPPEQQAVAERLTRDLIALYAPTHFNLSTEEAGH